MAIEAGVVIGKARNRHPSFVRDHHPNRLALEFLSDYAKELHGKVKAINPDLLRETQNATLPLDTFVEGIELDANRVVVQVTAVGADGSEAPMELIPAAQQFDAQIRQASCWQIGAKLFLLAPETAWSRVASINIGLVPIPASLTALDDALALPDTAERACVEAVAAFLGSRGPMVEGVKIDQTTLERRAEKAEEAFLSDVRDSFAGTVIRTRETYSP